MHISSTRAVVLIAIVGLMVPIPKGFVGEWTVRVSDYDNRPISGARVSLILESYTYNVFGEQDLYTNAEGKVTFGVQRKYGPLMYWIAKATANVVGFGMHAGFGTMGRVVVSEIPNLDAERKERLGRDQNLADALTSTCGSGCSLEKLDSHLHVPIP